MFGGDKGVLEAAVIPDTSFLPTGSIGQQNLPGTWQQWQSILPTGAVQNNPQGINNKIVENEFALMRHATVLFPGPATNGQIFPGGNVPVMAYSTIDLSNVGLVNGLEGKAHITSSRLTRCGGGNAFPNNG